MTKLFKNKKVMSKLISGLTLITLFLALSVTGVLGGFWRTIDGIAPGVTPASFLFGYGYGDLGTGYGYGYGTESGSGAGYYASNSGVFEVTDGADLAHVSTVVGTPSFASSATIESSISLSPTGEDVTITLYEGTVITNAAGGTFDALGLATGEAAVGGITLGTGETPVASVDFGTTGIKLNFSQPVRIDIPVSGVTGTIEVKVKHFGDANYGTSGLTELPGDTCTNGLPGTPGATATISGNIATIYTCSASNFVTYTSSSTTTSGGGGGGGGSTITTCTLEELICQEYSNIPGTYVYYRAPDTAYCEGGELGNTCTIDENTNTGTVIVGDDKDDHGCIGSAGYVRSDEKEECIRPWLEDETEENNKTESLFSDIGNSWAKGYILVLAGKSIVNGNDGKFFPNANTTRTEFLKMALKAFNHNYDDVDTSTLEFSDVDKADWKARVIKKALDLEIITGFNTNFRPDAKITRIEAIKILLKSADITLTETAETSFADVNTGWMKKYVKKSKELGIINGQIINGKLMFRPNDSITRAESSKVVVKTMNLK